MHMRGSGGKDQRDVQCKEIGASCSVDLRGLKSRKANHLSGMDFQDVCSDSVTYMYDIWSRWILRTALGSSLSRREETILLDAVRYKHTYQGQTMSAMETSAHQNISSTIPYLHTVIIAQNPKPKMLESSQISHITPSFCSSRNLVSSHQRASHAATKASRSRHLTLHDKG